MVGVDHARNDHMVLGVNDAVGCAWQCMRGANGLDAVVAHKNRGVFQFIASVVQRGNGVSVLNEQGGHGHDFA